ncbi:hypothetical protein [Moorena bouillonii]|uniref:Uncharacterized protein n=1 Tax=Moorena bouillonii PNG TaxID=568701 RepID=A0A1U7N7H8_9CYAN|nr:hypothetical protein [Moorena bouillonii]OLT61896.1 hypothetical protein BJP37_25575 [Moorena bouillonii PNG]
MSDLIPPQGRKTTEQIISEILVNYQEYHDRDNIQHFCKDVIEKRQGIKDKTKTLTDLNNALDTIDLIDSYHQSLISAQEQGKSKVNWLESTLEEITDRESERKRGEIVQEIQEALVLANNQQLASLSGEPTGVYTPLKEIEVEGINKPRVMEQQVLDDIQNNSMLSSISMAQQFDTLLDPLNLDYFNNFSFLDVADNYLNQYLEPLDNTFKQLVTLGTVVAKEEGHLGILDEVDIAQIAAMIDMGLTLPQIGYKLGKGEITLIEAVEDLYDREVAATCTLVSLNTKAVGWLSGTSIGATVGTVFGPIGTAVGGMLGSFTGKIAGKNIGQPIATGIKKVANFAKKAVTKTVKKAWAGAKSFGRAFTKSKLNPLNW